MIYRIINISESCYSEELYQKAYLAMTSQRQAKADRYKQEADKRCCVFADMLLREMLGEYFCIESPEFYTDEKGKPHLKGDTVHFSISHSGDYIACAAGSAPVGIDIEKIRTVELSLIKRVCTDEELSYVLSGNNADCERFLQVWCAKEAYLKYTGQGLSGGLKSITVADKAGIKSNPLPHLKLEAFSTEEYVCAIINES
ncbi:MAG: 4'-phosphopantetheinyl transferase superfamily protein [Ruminococcus sp.]|nr:4'-phosphopantetheinyl transferase superfamily protein [Ruminococcus sp.]